MISVSSDFKTAVKGDAKQMFAYLNDNDGTIITEGDDLGSLVIRGNGNMFQTVLRQATVKFWGSHSFLNKEVNLGIGVKLAGGTVEYIDYGKFIVKAQKYDKDTEQTTITLYDRMFEAHKSYALFDVEYPMTLIQYLQAICGALGWTLATTSFTNDSLVVSADLYAFQGFTFRQVIEHIAELACSYIYFNTGDELVVIPNGSSSVETLDTDLLREMSIEDIWGAVNSVVLATTPVDSDFSYRGGYVSPPILLEDGDELLMEDGEELLLEILVEMDGLFQVRFENNFIAEQDRETNIDLIEPSLTGLTFTPMESKTIFLGYLEIGDKVTLQDRDSNTYTSYITEIELEVSNGARETIRCGIPVKSRDNYDTSSNSVSDEIEKSSLDGSKNIQDDTITSAKIKELSADKITTGELQVGTELYIADSDGKVLIYIANVETEE